MVRSGAFARARDGREAQEKLCGAFEARTLANVKGFMVWAIAAISFGCSANGDSDASTLATDATVDGTNEESGGFDVGSMESTPVDTNCAAVESKAMIVKRPIDFIVLPDESPSMGTTRDAIANAMQDQVKKALDAAGIDYHVVWHGSWPLPALAGKLTYNKVGLGSGDDGMFRRGAGLRFAIDPEAVEDECEIDETCLAESGSRYVVG
jgi:hypothetical protein